MNRFKQLEVKKLISEYNFLLDEEEWKTGIIDEHKSEFLALISGQTSSDSQVESNLGPVPKQSKKFEVDSSTQRKAKTIYYQIANLTHPDRVNDLELNEMYQMAAGFYEENNILELYRIASQLKIKFEIEDIEILKFKEIIEDKRRFLQSLESSWLWLWLNAPTEIEKDNVIKIFLKQANRNI